MTQTLKSTSAGDTVYTWDLRGRMVGIDTNDDGTADVTYTYDSDDVRLSESAALTNENVTLIEEDRLQRLTRVV